jgi:hypothetical protein
MERIGIVETICRYPVKSMAGEHVAQAFVGFAGLMGDRAFAFVRTPGPKGVHAAVTNEAGRRPLDSERFRSALRLKNGFATSSGVNKSAKVVLGRVLINCACPGSRWLPANRASCAESSGDFPPPPPPGEKTTARQKGPYPPPCRGMWVVFQGLMCRGRRMAGERTALRLRQHVSAAGRDGRFSAAVIGVLSPEHRLHGARDIRLAASGDVAARRKEIDGVWAFDVNKEAGPLKIKRSARIVPLHSQIIAAGLLKYHAGLPRDGRLFPGLKGRASKGGKLGAALGDAFKKWRKEWGIVRKGVTFHSFRHGVASALEHAAVAETDAVRILGHDIPGMSFGTYSRGPGLRRLRDVIEQIRYPGVKL